MGFDGPFEGEPADGREKILRAAYVVLSADGYEGLSIGRIADEADLSKATVYHHFDDKDELMLAFLDFVTERIRHRLTRLEMVDPAERLHTLIDRMTVGRAPDEAGRAGGNADASLGAFVEVRAQAVHDEAYRDRIGQVDRTLRDSVAESIGDGVEQGAFGDVDPERAAETLLTLLLGALLRRSTTDADLESVREDAYEYVERCLRADSA